MKKFYAIVSLLIIASFLLIGCGETISGAVKDTKRIGKGIHKVFVKDNSTP